MIGGGRTRSPERVSGSPGIAARGALALLTGYKRIVSPLLPPACRFVPTCSEYAAEAIRKYGVVRGSVLAVGRLARCHPFHPGGVDPVR